MTSEMFDSAVFSFYMAHNRPCTASEIAEHASVSVAKVRMVIRDSKHKSDCVTIDRPVKEKHGKVTSYSRTVRAYQPSMATMRKEILGLRFDLTN